MKKNIILAIAVFSLLLLFGCTNNNPTPPQPTPSVPSTPSAPSVPSAPSAPSPPPVSPPSSSQCADKSCFISAANNCQPLTLAVDEEYGKILYSSSSACVFTKTYVSAKGETDEMRALLEGKSFSCKYEKGKFDQRLANSLVFGMENCEGELKDAIAKLLLFTQ